MTTKYAVLLRLTLRHAFYQSGLSEDFTVEPTPACRRLLQQSGLLFRPLPHGCAVYAEVDPASDPPALFRPLETDALIFSFLLRLDTPVLLNATALPEHAMGETVFYFSNLRDDQQDGRRHLGDPVADARVGPPIRVVPTARYTHRFDPPVNSATLTVTDLFGNERHRASFTHADPLVTVAAFVLNLDEAADLPPGRYVVADDHGGQATIYFDPGLYGKRAFGVVELFSRTDTLTPDATDRVPPDYRFLDGDELTGRGDYTIQFEARATTWRYIVYKRYDGSTVALDDLTLAGGAFTKTGDDEQVTFESSAEISLRETGQLHELHHNGTPLLDLPIPSLRAPLQAGASAGRFTSEIYVYL